MNRATDQFIRDINHHLFKSNSIQLYQIPPLEAYNYPLVTTKGSEPNRYKKLLMLAQQLLTKKFLQEERIKDFGSTIFQTVNRDISVLQHNNSIKNSYIDTYTKVEKTTSRAKEMMREMLGKCAQIQTKQMVMETIRHQYPPFSKQIKKYVNFTNQIHQTTVETPQVTDFEGFRFDHPQQSSIEDYDRSFQPLMTFILNFKSVIMSEYKNLVEADEYSKHPQMLQFLMNIKKLLIDSQTILISPQCTFNRMLMHVYFLQKINIQYLHQGYVQIGRKLKQLNLQLCKAVYIGEPIRVDIQKIKIKMSQSTQQIVNKIVTNSMNQQQTEVQLQQLKRQLKYLDDRLGIGKVEILTLLLNRKISKRKQAISSIEEGIDKLIRLTERAEEYSKLWVRLKETKKKANDSINEANNDIKIIETATDSKEEIAIIFKKSYKQLQYTLLQLMRMKEEIEYKQTTQQISVFRVQILPSKIWQLNALIDKIGLCEQELIGIYENTQERKQNLSISATLTKNQIQQQCNVFIQEIVSSMIGFSLRREDKVIGKAKKLISEIEKAENLVSMSNSNSQDISELALIRINLRWLVRALDINFSMKFIQSSMSELQFQYQDWKERINNFKINVSKIEAHVSQLTKITSTKNLSNLMSPVHRLVRDKTQLFEIILDIFMECCYVFEECKESQKYHLDMNGLSVLDEQALNYVYMMYQFKKKLRQQASELTQFQLPKALKDYLKDEIYTKFTDSFDAYMAYEEDELQVLAMRIQNAIKFKDNHENIFQTYEAALKKTKRYDANVVDMSRQIVMIERENRQIIQLQQSKFKLKKLSIFEDIHESYSDFFKLAREIVRNAEEEDLRLSNRSNNPNKSLLSGSHKLMI